jgi:twitching motility protein PilI
MSQANATFSKLLEFEKRALAFQPGQGLEQGDSGEWSGVVFRIGDTRLTCGIDRVHEFISPPPVTRVPGTKPWILGLANVRGDLVTIVDLPCYLYGERSRMTSRTRLLSASLRGQAVGLLVDEVFGQRNFVSAEAGPAELDDSETLRDFVNKEFRAGNEVWQELDLDLLFNTPEFLNGAAA